MRQARQSKMTNDPLSILIVPHSVIEWQKKRGLLVEKFFPEISKTEKEKGKWAIFHEQMRLNFLFDDRAEAAIKLREILGEKKKCWENKRIFHIEQLPHAKAGRGKK